MKKMKRFCVVCGKELEIILDDNSKIISGGGYWKFSTESQGIDFEPKTGEEQKEYWECEECMGDDEDEDKLDEELDEELDVELDEEVAKKLNELLGEEVDEKK